MAEINTEVILLLSTGLCWVGTAGGLHQLGGTTKTAMQEEQVGVATGANTMIRSGRLQPLCHPHRSSWIYRGKMQAFTLTITIQQNRSRSSKARPATLTRHKFKEIDG